MARKTTKGEERSCYDVNVKSDIPAAETFCVIPVPITSNLMKIFSFSPETASQFFERYDRFLYKIRLSAIYLLDGTYRAKRPCLLNHVGRTWYSQLPRLPIFQTTETRSAANRTA